jgi:hypothetical protein
VPVTNVSKPIARRNGAEIVKWVDEEGSGLSDSEIAVWRAYRARFQRDQLSQAVGGRPPAGVGVLIAGDDPVIASSFIGEWLRKFRQVVTNLHCVADDGERISAISPAGQTRSFADAGAYVRVSPERGKLVGGSGFLWPAAHHYWRHLLADQSAGD